MLFDADTRAKVADGSVTVAFRRWKRPTVKTGGTLTTPVGVLAIDEVAAIAEDEVSDADATAAGADSAAAVLADPALRRDGKLYRIRFHRQGDDPRIALRAQADVSAEDLDRITARLDRWDTSSRHGAWTRSTLRAIDDRPGVRAGDLADDLGRDTPSFKTDVRKLKSLGLTESLEVGYRLSPRGRAVLRQIDR